MKRFGILGAAIVLMAMSAAQVSAKDYVIMARGQGSGSTAIDDAVANAGGTITGRHEAIGVVFASSDNASFATTLAADARIQNVVADVEVQWIPDMKVEAAGELDPASLPANAETFSGWQWNLRAIGADQTAAHGDRGKGARVVVLDSGIVTNHVDIAPNLNLALSTSFVPGEGLNPPNNVFNHGTHVAGIIAAPVNGIGTQGVAPEAEIVAVKVLRATGSGSFTWLINGLMYAASIGADVANMSLGATFDRINAGGDGSGSLIAALNRAINHATQSGILCVSAAGNEGMNLDSRIWSIPAQSGNGIAVSATAPLGWAVPGGDPSLDHFASYSNYGRSVVNVAAPGGDSAYPGNENCTVGSLTRPCWILDLVISPGGRNSNTASTSYFFAAGTSMAAPHVSGLAALIVGRYGHMPPAQLKARIEHSAFDLFKPGADAQSGNGRVDALKALEE